jgi:hypothetical protein
MFVKLCGCKGTLYRRMGCTLTVNVELRTVVGTKNYVEVSSTVVVVVVKASKRQFKLKCG